MDLTLLTYDSFVVHNAGSVIRGNAKAFAQTLLKLVESFSKEIGVSEEEVYWIEATNSNWCKGMLIIYSYVPNDWQPTKNTTIRDEVYQRSIPNLVSNLSGFIKGEGANIDLNDKDCAPLNPHKLFHSKHI